MNAEILKHIELLSALPHEKVLVFYLNGDKIVGTLEQDGKSSNVFLSLDGIVNKAKELNAIEVVMLHNHPGGTRYPSQADIEYARGLQTALPGTMVNSYVVKGNNVGRSASLSEPTYTEYDGDFDPTLHNKEFIDLAVRTLRESGLPFQLQDIKQMFSKVQDMVSFREVINGVLKPFGKTFDLKDDYKQYDSMKKEDSQITKTSLSHKINLNEAIDKKKLGRCYELSGRYALNHPDYTLIHGTITRKDGYTIPHAWVSKQVQMGKYPNVTTVYDPVMDLELPWDAYERLLGAKIKHAYNKAQLTKNILYTENWGPWEPLSEKYVTSRAIERSGTIEKESPIFLNPTRKELLELPLRFDMRARGSIDIAKGDLRVWDVEIPHIEMGVGYDDLDKVLPVGVTKDFKIVLTLGQGGEDEEEVQRAIEDAKTTLRHIANKVNAKNFAKIRPTALTVVAEDIVPGRLQYCATCQAEEWKGIIADDATELAQIVDNGISITRQQFYKIANVDSDTKQEIDEIQKDGYPEDVQFGFNKEQGVAWYHNTVSDVHYFYKSLGA